MGGKKMDTTSEVICDTWAEGFRGWVTGTGSFGRKLPASVEEDEHTATVFCYATATHYKESATKGKTRTYVGTYNLGLIKTSGGWRINRFAYKLKYEAGNVKLVNKTFHATKAHISHQENAHSAQVEGFFPERDGEAGPSAQYGKVEGLRPERHPNGMAKPDHLRNTGRSRVSDPAGRRSRTICATRARNTSRSRVSDPSGTAKPDHLRNTSTQYE